MGQKPRGQHHAWPRQAGLHPHGLVAISEKHLGAGSVGCRGVPPNRPASSKPSRLCPEFSGGAFAISVGGRRTTFRENIQQSETLN